MKNLFSLILVCVFATSFAFACPPDGEGEKKASTDQSGGDLVVGKFAALNLEVIGMTCGGCENKVKAALKGIDGVVETQSVSAEGNLAVLTFDPSVTSSEAIVKVLGEKTGYAVSVSKNAGVAKSCTSASAKACCANKTEAEKKACSKEAEKSCTKSKETLEKE